MSKPKRKCCGTCRYGWFQKADSGRIKRKAAGQCEYVVPMPERLPDCVTQSYYFRADYFKTSRQGIWPDFGDECPCYEERA